MLVGLSVTACDVGQPVRAAPTFAPRATATPGADAVARGLPGGKGGIVRVTRGKLSQIIQGRGSVSSVRQSFLFFNIAGVISKISVASGDQVKQSAPIAQLDTFQLEQDVNSAKYEADKTDLLLRQSQARLASYDTQIETANNSLPRFTELRNQLFQIYKLKAPTPADHYRAIGEYQQYLAADTDVQKTTTELNSLKTNRQITALEIDLYQKQFAYQQQRLQALQARLNGANLTAPLTGLVLSVDKNVGDSVQAFEPIGSIADPSQLQIEVSIGENDVTNLSVGQAARIVLDGFSDKTFSGKAKEIASKASIFQGKNVYRILVSFDNQSQVPATLRMGADVSFVLQDKDNVLIVPANAVQQDGLRRYVTLVRDGKPERVEVQVGATSGNQVEIITGVSEGDQVVVP